MSSVNSKLGQDLDSYESDTCGSEKLNSQSSGKTDDNYISTTHQSQLLDDGEALSSTSSCRRRPPGGNSSYSSPDATDNIRRQPARLAPEQQQQQPISKMNGVKNNELIDNDLITIDTDKELFNEMLSKNNRITIK